MLTIIIVSVVVSLATLLYLDYTELKKNKKEDEVKESRKDEFKDEYDDHFSDHTL
jgi:hypothetical protein